MQNFYYSIQKITEIQKSDTYWSKIIVNAEYDLPPVWCLHVNVRLKRLRNTFFRVERSIFLISSSILCFKPLMETEKYSPWVFPTDRNQEGKGPGSWEPEPLSNQPIFKESLQVLYRSIWSMASCTILLEPTVSFFWFQ